MPKRKSDRAWERLFHSRVTDLEREYRRVALHLFATEIGSIAETVRQASRLGGVRAVQQALRAIERAYVNRDGIYHRAWTRAYDKLNAVSFEGAGRDLRIKTGLHFRLDNPAARRAATRRAAGLADVVGTTTAARVTSAVDHAITSGGGIREIRTAILDDAFGDAITTVRADRIARTETVGSLNAGEYEQAVASEVFGEKSWLHSGNANPRDWHLAMDGERVGITERYSNGLLHPGEQGAPPEEVVNCGCTELFYPA